MTIHPYDVIFVGLAFDIVGAYVLAQGLMFKSPEAAYGDAQTRSGMNSRVFLSALEQTAEARLGTVFLVFGFALQAFGNLHGGIEATSPGWIDSSARVLGLVFAVGLTGSFLRRGAIARARIPFYRMAFKDYEGPVKLDPPVNDPTWHNNMAWRVGLRRRFRESDAHLLTRIEQRRIALSSKYGGRPPAFIRN